MDNKNTIETAKGAISLVGEVIKVAGDNPNVKEAANELGKTALTLTKTINNALLPIAAINFGFEKAKNYFSFQFESDIEEKAKKIPKERLIEPKASVAGPALQGLAFSHDEESLRDMYLNLLASAMDSQTSEDTHPAFVEIIKQMDTNDAKIASLYLNSDTHHPIVEIRRKEGADNSWTLLKQHVLNLIESTTDEPTEVKKLSAIIDNLIRLGLITVNYTTYLTNSDSYDWVESRPEFLQLKETNKNSTVVFQRGSLKPTSLGVQFSKAVGIGESESTS